MSSKSNEKQVEVVRRERERERKGPNREVEEDEADQYEKLQEEVAVTRQLCIKPIENCGKEVVLRRIRHRKRVNKIRAAVGAILSSPFSTKTVTDKAATNAASLQEMRWLDDAFAAL